jgi:hypothetical protein
MVGSLDCLTLEDETERLSRNVDTKLPFYAASNRKRAQTSIPYHYGCNHNSPLMKILFLVSSIKILTYFSKAQFNIFSHVPTGPARGLITTPKGLEIQRSEPTFRLSTCYSLHILSSFFVCWCKNDVGSFRSRTTQSGLQLLLQINSEIAKKNNLKSPASLQTQLAQ